MLVLSRKNLQSVVVGGADGSHRLLKITVLGINGANVKLGFEELDTVTERHGVWGVHGHCLWRHFVTA